MIGIPNEALQRHQVVGAGRRAGRCHKCGAFDRENLIFLYLRDFLHLINDQKDVAILHIAPEKHLTELMLKQGYRQYVCGDKFTEGYQYPAHVVDLDILELSYDADTFDLVLCNHVLEHIPDDAAAMRELCRVLKPGGQALLQVPVSATLAATYEDANITESKARELAFGQFDHVRIYGQDYAQRLQQQGFQVERVKLNPATYEKYGINLQEELYVAAKPSHP